MSLEIEELLVSVGSQKTIDFWNLKKGSLSRSVRTPHKDTIACILYVPSKNSYVTSCRNSSIYVSSFKEDGKPIFSPLFYDQSIGYIENMCQLNEKESSSFCSSTSEYGLALWNLDELENIKTVKKAHGAMITSCIADLSNKQYFTSCEEGIISVWDQELTKKHTFEDKKTGIISHMCYSQPKGIISHCGWNNLTFSTLKDGKLNEIQRVRRKDDIICLCTSPQSQPNYLYTVEQGGNLSYYDYRKLTKQPVVTFTVFSKNSFSTRVHSFMTKSSPDPVFLSYTSSQSPSFSIWGIESKSEPMKKISIPSNSGVYRSFLTIPPASLPPSLYMSKEGDELKKRLREMREELRMLKSFYDKSVSDLRGLQQKLSKERSFSEKARQISEKLQTDLETKERELLTVHANYMDRMMAQQKEFDEKVSVLQHHQEAEEEKRIEGVRKNIESQKRKELDRRLTRNRGLFKKAESELGEMKRQLEKRSQGGTGPSKSLGGHKKKSSSLFSIFNSKSETSILQSGNAFTSAYFVSHGENPIQKKEKELEQLGSEIKRLEKVNKILAEPNLVHGKSKSDEFMRNYLGFIVKEVEVRDYTTNEVKFLEELNGKYIDGVENSFMKEKLTPEQRRYFPQYYGHWIEKGGEDEEGGSKPDTYKISIERGKSDLRTYIKSHQFSPKTKLHLVLEAARGLNVLHTNNLIHGDVKPHNFAVFLDTEDKVIVKVIDFENVGLAVRKMDGIMSGSPCYHDPRLFDVQEGDIEVFGKNRDVFSFGCVIWNIFVEETPFVRFLRDVIYKHYHNFFQMRDLSYLFSEVIIHEDSDYHDPITKQGFLSFLKSGKSNKHKFSNSDDDDDDEEEEEEEEEQEQEETEGEGEIVGKKEKEVKKKKKKNIQKKNDEFDSELVMKVIREARTEQSLFPLLSFGFDETELKHIPSFVKKMIHECLFFDESLRPTMSDIIRKIDKIFERDRISGNSPFSLFNIGRKRKKNRRNLSDDILPKTDDSINNNRKRSSSTQERLEEEEDEGEINEELLIANNDDNGYIDPDVAEIHEEEEEGLYEEIDFSMLVDDDDDEYGLNNNEDDEDLEPDDELRPPKTNIHTQHIKNWGVKEVQEWLTYHYFTDGYGFRKYKNSLKVKGKQLMKLKWRKVGFETESHENEMKACVESLTRISGKFDYKGLETVFKKLQVMIVRHSVTSLASIENILTLVRNLALPSYMVRTYLNPEIMKMDVDKFLKKEVMREEDAKGKDESFQIDYEPLKEKVDELKEKESYQHLRKKDPKETRFPCKLVLTEIAQTSGQKTIRKLLSPIMSKIPGFHNKYGMFHSALIIGPWLIEWNNSALVIPRKLRSSMAFMSADLNTTTMLKNISLDEVTRRLATVICRWNTQMFYKNMNIKGSKRIGNCQDFVDEVMKDLGITLDYSMGTSYANFINKMKSKGEIEFEFIPPKRMAKVFDLKLRSYKFETHLDLDNFMQHLKEKNEVELTSEFEEDRLFLKSLDRAYWLRFFRQPDDPRYKPSPSGCFFKDPRLTKVKNKN